MLKASLIAIALLLAAPAVAQQATIAQANPPEYNIKVTAPELDTIGKALGGMPFNDVVGLIQKLRQQVVEQQKPTPEPEKK